MMEECSNKHGSPAGRHTSNKIYIISSVRDYYNNVNMLWSIYIEGDNSETTVNRVLALENQNLNVSLYFYIVTNRFGGTRDIVKGDYFKKLACVICILILHLIWNRNLNSASFNKTALFNNLHCLIFFKQVSLQQNFALIYHNLSPFYIQRRTLTCTLNPEFDCIVGENFKARLIQQKGTDWW